MTSFYSHFVRFVAGLLTVAIVAVGVYVPMNASRVEAQAVLSFETNPALLGGIAATAIASADQTLISKVLNALAWTVAKVAIQTMTKSIVSWINGGFEGSPAFETDLQNSLRRLGDGVAQGFLSQMANEAAIRSPFSDQLITNVGAAYYLYSGREGLASRLRYTLNESAADDRAFLAGDFSQGGWNAWFSAFQNPANNPFGAQMIASQELSNRISAAAVQRTQELGWGSGFLSWKGDCVDKTNGSAHTGSGGTTTNTAQGSVSSQSTSGVGGTNTGSGLSEAERAARAASTPSTHTLSDAEGCLEHEIQTPGSVIEGTLIPNINSPLHQLELADSINEIIGALAQQLVSKVIGGGGLRGVSNPGQGGGKSALEQASDSSQYSGNVNSLRGGFDQGVANSRAQTESYRASWQKIADAAAAAKAACGTSSETIQAVLDRSAKALARASEALAALDQIRGRSAALNTAGDDPATVLTGISNSYLDLLSNGTLPSAAELTEAAGESQDTGSATPGSLYSQMTRLSSARLCAFTGN